MNIDRRITVLAVNFNSQYDILLDIIKTLEQRGLPENDPVFRMIYNLANSIQHTSRLLSK